MFLQYEEGQRDKNKQVNMSVSVPNNSNNLSVCLLGVSHFQSKDVWDVDSYLALHACVSHYHRQLSNIACMQQVTAIDSYVVLRAYIVSHYHR